MKQVTLPLLRIRDFTRGTAMLYPSGYNPPYEVYVRAAFHEYPAKMRNDGLKVDVPQIGTVTFPGGSRRFTFMPTNAYADQKGYPRGKVIEGDW